MGILTDVVEEHNLSICKTDAPEQRLRASN